MKIKPGLTAHLSKNRLYIHKAMYDMMGKPRKLALELESRGMSLWPDIGGVVVQTTRGGLHFVRPRSYTWRPGNDIFFSFHKNAGEVFQFLVAA